MPKHPERFVVFKIRAVMYSSCCHEVSSVSFMRAVTVKGFKPIVTLTKCCSGFLSFPFLPVIPLPTTPWSGLLPPATGAASRPEAAESADNVQGRAEAGRLRPGAGQVRADKDLLE